MTTRFSISISRLAAGAAALAAGLLAFAPASWAQGVATLSGAAGNSCSYTQVTTLPNGNITVTCGAAVNSATITIGTVGSLDAGLPDTANVPVACSGTGCNGVAVSVAVSPAVAGVDVIGTATHTYAGASTQTFNVGGTAPASGTAFATVVVTVTSQGTASTTTPDLNGTVSKNIAIVDTTAAGTLSFSPTLASVTEGAAAVNVSVLRTGSGAQAATVTVAYSCSTLARRLRARVHAGCERHADLDRKRRHGQDHHDQSHHGARYGRRNGDLHARRRRPAAPSPTRPSSSSRSTRQAGAGTARPSPTRTWT